MKVYKTKTGIVIEKENKFYLLKDKTGMNLSMMIIFFKKSEKLIHCISCLMNRIDRNEILAPVGNQELWACGVTYLRSKIGRQEESKDTGGADFYAKVYEAERPEVFFKSTPHRIVGHKGKVNIRKDSTWDVPEPELTWSLLHPERLLAIQSAMI